MTVAFEKLYVVMIFVSFNRQYKNYNDSVFTKSPINHNVRHYLVCVIFTRKRGGLFLSTKSKKTIPPLVDMVNFEKVYQKVGLQIIERCHGEIKITKHGKIIQVYDTKRHIWSNGLASLIIKEECKNANLKDWEFANVRSYVIKELLGKSKK